MSASAASVVESKYVVYGPGDTVEFRTKTLKPKAGHVLVQVYANGVNPVEAKRSIGDKLPKSMERLSFWLVKGTPVGFEFSGVVAEDNNDCGYKKGDQVFGSMPPPGGSMGTYISVPEHQLAPKPTSLSFEEASCLPLVGLTALQALKEYSDGKAKSICIVGASGGTGHVAIQVAKQLGFTTIVAVCSTRNLEFCKVLGATRTIDYTKETVAQDLKNIVGDDNVDITMDCVTSGDPADQAMGYPQMLLPLTNIRYLRLGGVFSDWCVALVERWGWNLFGKEKLFWIRFPHSKEELLQLKGYCDAGHLKPKIEKTVPFTIDGIQEAFADIMSRRAKGKIVIQVKEE